MKSVFTLFFFLFFLSHCSGSEDSKSPKIIQSSSELKEKLNNAKPGEIINLAGKVFEGSFKISRAVTLKGTTNTVIKAKEKTGLFFDFNDGKVQIENLKIISSSVAIYAWGKAKLELKNVTFEIEKGFGLILEEAESFSGVSLKFKGSADENSFNKISSEIKPIGNPVSAVFIKKVKQFSLKNTQITGFFGTPLVIIASKGSIDQTELYKNFGSQVLIENSELEINDSSIKDSFSGNDVGVFTITEMGLVISKGSLVKTKNLILKNIKFGYSLFQDKSNSEHEFLNISGSKLCAIWVQNSKANGNFPAFKLSSKSKSIINSNYGNAFVFLNSENLELNNVEIKNTQFQLMNTEKEGVKEKIADGLQVKGAIGSVSLSNVLFNSNESGNFIRWQKAKQGC